MRLLSDIEVLHRNLRALAEVQPLLARRIALPASQEHIEEQASGQVLYHYGRLPRPLNLNAEEANACQNVSPTGVEMVIAGVGLGETVASALERGHARVHAWDRDPMVWRLALSRHDWATSIRTGRLVMYLGADGILIPRSPLQTLWAHPVLRPIYKQEIHLLRQGLSDKRALICDGSSSFETLRSLSRPRATAPTPGASSPSLSEELAHTVAVFKPEVVFAVNFSRDLSEACRRFQLPLAIWEIDPSTEFLPRSEHPQTHTTVFTYRQGRVADYQRANFPNCVHLPLASNPERRRPEALTPRQRTRFDARVSFVGASMVETAQKFRSRFIDQFTICYPNCDPAQVGQFLQGILDLQRQDLSRWMIPELLAQQVPDFVARCRERHLENPVVLAGEIAAAEKRLTCVARLASLDIQVWGDAGWKHLKKHGVTHRGYAGHFKELNLIYGNSQVNIDIGRIYQSDIVPMRIFDILACGGFVIAEYTEELESLFVLDEELAWLDDPEELVEKTAYFLEHPEHAQAIAERVDSVLREHRIQDRVHTMLNRTCGHKAALAS